MLEKYLVRIRCPICGTIIKLCSRQGTQFYICPECYLCFRKDVLSTNPVILWEGDYYTNEQIIKHHMLRNSAFRNIERIIYSSLGRRGKILDVGCGVGTFLEIAKQREWQVEGVEPSPTAAKVAQLRTGAQIYQEDFLTLDYIGHFDAITIFDVLRTIPDPKQFIQKVFDMIKPSGVCVIRETNAWYGRTRREKSSMQKKIQEYMQEWTPISIEKALLKIGFSNVQIYPSPVFIDGNENRIYRLLKPLPYIIFKWVHLVSARVISPNMIAIARK